MSENLKEMLTKKILTNIPKDKKPINYLMDILNIGRESTYRRMRGDIPFTFEEIIKLSVELNFSIDDIVKKNRGSNGYLPDFQQKNTSDFAEHFLVGNLNCCKVFESISNANETEIMLSLNRLFPFFVVDFDKLFKFYYYRWMHKCGSVSMNCSFSEIELPAHIVSVQQEINAKISLIKSIIFIFDQYIFARLIRELQYYYSRNLISSEEIEEIKNDLSNFLNFMERYIQMGKNAVGSTYHFYLSMLDVDMNSMYGTFDGNVISQCWTCGNTPVNTGHDDMHKNWIYSLKRSSILISRSNEIVQASFLNEQHKSINRITNDLYLYYG